MIAIAIIAFSRPPKPVAKNVLISPSAQTKGPKDASVWLVEFSDYQCPACKTFELTVEEILKKYDGKILFAYRHFPLDQHPLSFQAALVSEAAGKQGKFWEMHSLLFQSQDKMSETLWGDLAKQLNLDNKKFDADLSLPELKQKVQNDRADGIRLRIQATPTFFLNGIRLTLNTPADLTREVEKIIK